MPLFRFVPVMYPDAALKHIDNKPQSTFDEIIEKYVEMNVVHPFRDGKNSIGQRNIKLNASRIFEIKILMFF